jgi:hypothetical protein
MSSKLFKKISFVKQCIHQVWVVVKRICQAGIDDLQHHSNHFFNDTEVLGLIKKVNPNTVSVFLLATEGINI